MNISLETNIVYDHLALSNKRFIVEQGGTRSGKTYNILIWIIMDYCMRNTGKTISITRKAYPALRATAMRDFFDILKTHGLYDETRHSMTTSEYNINGNMVEFISLDQPQKIRGRKRDLCFINEGNELSAEDFFQLNIRTTERVIIDYNPSDEFHWIYDQIITREDCDFHITTYKNNPFLSASLIAEIERLKEIDANYWRVYGMGERGQSKGLVFTISECEQVPATAKRIGYGLDFGFTNDPSSLIESFVDGDNIYFDELIYQTGMTNSDLVNMFKSLNIDTRDIIWADSSEPKAIHELHRFGFNVKPTAKGQDSINLGIDLMRRYKIMVTKRSFNLMKEFRNYKYIEDKMGRLTNKPVDAFNHGIDACRYSVINTMTRPNIGKYSIR